MIIIVCFCRLTLEPLWQKRCGRLKKERGVPGERKKKEEMQKGKEKGNFFLSPPSPIPFPSSPNPWMPFVQASVK